MGSELSGSQLHQDRTILWRHPLSIFLFYRNQRRTHPEKKDTHRRLYPLESSLTHAARLEISQEGKSQGELT